MGDDGRDVETTLDHRPHLVPRLEHFPPVDALDLEALPDDVVPVDLRVGPVDAEERDPAAGVHRLDHLVEARTRARHLETDVEALDHAELLHHVLELLVPRVHRARRAEAPREVEAVVVHVDYDDVPRADVLRYPRRHDANRARASNQDVFADHVERKRRVRRVSERVEDGVELVVDRRIAVPHVRLGDAEILGEGAVAVHANALRLAAEVALPGAAVAAVAAHDVPFAAHALADLHALDVRADLHDLADVFVADGKRRLDLLLRPGVPLVDVDVGSADGGLLDLDEDVVYAHLGHRLLNQFHALLRRDLRYGFHLSASPVWCFADYAARRRHKPPIMSEPNVEIGVVSR